MTDDRDQQQSPAGTAGLSFTQDVIASLATAPGLGAVAMVRVSGPNCRDLIQKAIKWKSMSAPSPRVVARASIIDPTTDVVLDDALVLFFQGPKSYTGEDVIEINLHGGPYIVQQVLRVLYSMGCRPADPGEFTRRAYLHGKLDLTAAEGIKHLVEAQTHQQWIAGQHLSQGRLASSIDQLRHQLIQAMAYLEARIDFPDEDDTSDVELRQVRSLVQVVHTSIQKLISTYSSGRIAAEGLRVALVGSPNAGKSTLFNSMLGTNRALVTEIAGTTRDYIEETCLIRGRMLRLIDTAGLRETHDPVEKLGIEQSRRLLGEADVILLLCASDADPVSAAQLFADADLHSGGASKILRVLTKSDLGVPSWAIKDWLPVSCKLSGGLEHLSKTLVEIIDSHVGQLSESTFVTSARHHAALEQAQNQCQAFFQAFDADSYDEILAFELQGAARSLSSIIGDVSNEDILDRIFSEFCVGK